jgi:hypothetical protein
MDCHAVVPKGQKRSHELINQSLVAKMFFLQLSRVLDKQTH